MHSYKLREEELKLNKIAALYSNEMIKISHRISVWIVTVVMIAIAILAPIAFSAAEEGLYEDENYWDTVDFKADLIKKKDSLAQTLGDTNDFVRHSNVQFTINNERREVFSTWLDCDEEKASDYSDLICANNLLSGYDFDARPYGKSWLSVVALRSYYSCHHQICQMNRTPFEERNDEWYSMFMLYSQAFDYYYEALFTNNMQSFYNGEKLLSTVGDNYYEPEIIQRVIDIDPSGTMTFEETATLMEMLVEMHSTELALQSNLNLSRNELPRILTASDKAHLQDKVSILNYKFVHRQHYSEKSAFAHQLNTLTISLGRFALIILLVLVAGTSVSQEMATGSIKSLIIAPVRRWKIFLAKLLSITTWCIAGGLLLVLTSTLTTMLLHSDISLPSYLYVSGGTIHYIPYLLYMILTFFVDSLSLFVYILLAFMISCITKNSGISVAVSSGLILGANLPTILVAMIGRKRWIDFLPSINMNISNLVFPFSKLMYGTTLSELGSEEALNNPLSFSLIYTGVLVIILLAIAYDAFTRRDIQ